MIHAAKPLFALAVATLAASPLAADGLSFRTAYTTSGSWASATSLDAALGFQNRRTGTGDVRMMWTHSAGSFRFEVHSALSFSQGGDVAYATAIAPFLPATVPATYFDLTQTWFSNLTTLATNTIDRLNVTFTTPSLVIRVGRQAITWGSGTVFHPGDIVAPFPPDATDTSYKTGADMVYLQYLFDNGADVQLIGVPRPAVTGGPVDYDSSSYAMRARLALGSLDSSVMLARDRGDTVASLGLSGALGGASWNAEYVHWTLADGASHPSWLVNISNFGTIGNVNIAYFAEAFHNGFGVDAATPLDSLPASLTKRMSTGQVFYAGQDFLALGAQIQMTADLTVSPNTIVSLNDHSALASVAVNYTLGDNTNLVFNYFQTLGGDGTEFGGRETSAGSGVFAGAARAASLQLVHFF